MRMGNATTGLLSATITAVVLTGCAGTPTAEGEVTSGSNTLEPPTMNLVGTVVATNDLELLFRRAIRRGFNQANTVGRSPCRPDPSTGVERGTQVTVADPSTGEALGLAELDPGVIGGTRRQRPIDRPCDLSFRVYDVPEDREFYEFEIVGVGSVQFTQEEISDPFTITVD